MYLRKQALVTSNATHKERAYPPASTRSPAKHIRRNRLRSGRCSRFALLITTVLLLALFSLPPVLAATITVDGTCSLADAIRSANTDAMVRGAPEGLDSQRGPHDTGQFEA